MFNLNISMKMNQNKLSIYFLKMNAPFLLSTRKQRQRKVSMWGRKKLVCVQV